MADEKGIATRINHLWGLAWKSAEKSPELSRFYLSEIQSLGDENPDNFPDALSLLQKFCHHCYSLFNADNCHVRLLPKRGEKKKNTKKRIEKLDNKDQCQWKGNKAVNLPRKLNHVSILCKTCGERSYFPGLPRKPVGKSNFRASSMLSTPRSSITAQDSTLSLSRSAKRRQRQHSSKLRDILQSDERNKLKSPGTVAPRLQDFLSSL